ncbi:calcium-binding protein [Pacificimonas sp. WHA3]|uniref:Calcium-binding protein n=1 Tax=Pacificimonas pallii TaxID=2827236 RepID=A0ABS6SC77_9SPHN|nr:DUF4114 domain-containing protein [Pacificimonas pallii]MBV7255511.1 calcium-binding protein [Pacificimonas pallii]
MLILSTDGETFENNTLRDSPNTGTSAVNITADNVTFINGVGGIVQADQDEGFTVSGANTTIRNLVGGIVRTTVREPLLDAIGTSGAILFENFGERTGRLLFSPEADTLLEAGTVNIVLEANGAVDAGAVSIGMNGGDDMATFDFATLTVNYVNEARAAQAPDAALTRALIGGGAGNDTFTIDNLDGSFDFFRVDGVEDLVLAASDGAIVDTVIDGNTSDFQASARLAIGLNVNATIQNVDFDNITVQSLTSAFVNVGIGTLTADSGDNAITLSGSTTVSGAVNLGDGNDSVIIQTGAAIGAAVNGGDGADTLTGGDFADILIGGAGNDIITGGGGADTLTGGLGDDTFIGTLAQLAQDTITDFSDGDVLQISDAFTVVETTGEESLTATISGGAQFVLNVAGDYAGSGFIASGQASGTTRIQELADLIALSEGNAVAGGGITAQGAVVDNFLSSTTSADFQVTVQPADANAGFDNSLGVYEIRGDGSLGDVRILVGNVKDGGSFAVEDLDAGSRLGFFIVQDGANSLTPGQTSSTALGLDIVGGTAILTDGGTAIAGATIFLSHDSDLNIDNQQHALTGAENDGSGRVNFAFEDLLRSGASDDDFQDVVFVVEPIIAGIPVIG